MHGVPCCSWPDAFRTFYAIAAQRVSSIKCMVMLRFQRQAHRTTLRLRTSLFLFSVVALVGVHASGDDAQLPHRRLCVYYGRRCWVAYNAKNSTKAAVECGECWKNCDKADGVRDSARRRGYCRWVCDKLNCDDETFNSHQRDEEQTVNQTAASNTSNVTSTNSVVTGGANSTDGEAHTTTPTPTSRAKVEDKPWVWIGPCLGAVATLFGAFITVYAVRDHVYPNSVEGEMTIPHVRMPPPLGVNAPRTRPHEYVSCSPTKSNHLWW